MNSLRYDSFGIPKLPLLLLVGLSILIGCNPNSANQPVNSAKVAFLADVHFHDIFADFGSEHFPSLDDGTPVFVRSMGAQIRSTRLFNENYFALVAALDSIVKQDIQYVVLNGDISDDGQPINISGLKRILHKYEEEHDIRFFLSFGNHDPYLPYTHPAGKSNFLLRDGRVGGVYSLEHPLCRNETALCLEGLEELGYEDLFDELSQYGFIPRESDIHFETPFSYRTDFDEKDISHRAFTICGDDDWCGTSFDTSYLVEPEPGIWILSIDANVHIPRQSRENDDPKYARNYSGSGNAGFNGVLQHKPFLLNWLADVAERASANGKQLFAFSHFPAGDFYHESGDALAQLFGETGIQLGRLPKTETQGSIAEIGLPFHVGGHMHLNNTHALRDQNENIRTWGIQSPSLAALLPAYTVIHYSDIDEIQVKTIVLEDIPRFRTLFDLYRTEWHQADNPGWEIEILETETYLEYTKEHLRQLTVNRFVPEDWPNPLKEYLHTHSLNELATKLGIQLPQSCASESPLMQLVVDFYLFRNAGSFANTLINDQTIQCYNDLASIHRIPAQELTDTASTTENLSVQFALLLELLKSFSKPLPDLEFTISISEESIHQASVQP